MRRTIRRFLIAMILCTLTISAAPAFADTTLTDDAKAGQVRFAICPGVFRFVVPKKAIETEA